MNKRGRQEKKIHEIRRERGRWPDADSSSLRRARTSFTQLVKEGNRNREANSDQSDAAPAVKEHIVEFLPGRIPIVKRFAHRPGHVPDQPKQDEHSYETPLHNVLSILRAKNERQKSSARSARRASLPMSVWGTAPATIWY